MVFSGVDVFIHVASIYANLLEQKKALFNSRRIDLEHQHGRRFIVLEHQYGRRDVMWKCYGAALREMRLAIQAWIAASYPYITYLLHSAVFQLYLGTCARTILFWACALFVYLFKGKFI